MAFILPFARNPVDTFGKQRLSETIKIAHSAGRENVTAFPKRVGHMACKERPHVCSGLERHAFSIETLHNTSSWHMSSKRG
jgi:hypothetical protein